MKVAYIFGGLNRGGAETLALDVFGNSNRSGINFICIHRKRGELYDTFHQSGIRIFELKPKSLFDFFYLLKVRKLLLAEKVEIAHTHQVVDSFIVLLATMFTKIKTIQTFHGHGYDYTLAMRFMRWWVLKFNNKNVFVSNSQLEYYKEKYRVPALKCCVVYNGISFNKFEIKPANNIRPELGIDTDTLLTGTVGNFASGRDQLTICKFLKLLSDSGIMFKHIFVGGISKPEPWRYQQCIDYCLQNNLNNKVVFLGKRTDVPEILLQLDAFIYSTNHDTFGIALLEAIAAGIPVFANDWRVFKEITLNGKLATLYKTKNEVSLFEKFSNFLKDKDSFSKKASEASGFVTQTYTIENHINKLTELYSNLIVPKIEK